MDGPYSIQVTREAGDQAVAECIESRRQDTVVGSFRIDIMELRREIEDIGRKVLSACRERHWDSDYVSTLARLLDRSTESRT